MRWKFFREGEHYVWATGALLTVVLIMALTLMGVVLSNGLSYFWPARLAHVALKDGGAVMGEVVQWNLNPQGQPRAQVKVGNRDLYGQDFRWIDQADMRALTYPDNALKVERATNGDFHGTLTHVPTEGLGLTPQADQLAVLQAAMKVVRRRLAEIKPVQAEMTTVNLEMESIRLEMLKLRHQGGATKGAGAARLAELEALALAKRKAFDALNEQISTFNQAIRQYQVEFTEAGGQTKRVPVADVVRVYPANRLGWLDRLGIYFAKVWELLSAEPRESNTEGGVFPQLFGTVMMVFTMSLFAIPLGVVAAIYLSEYAKQGMLVRLVRIAVYNLAGVPSIVYGVFGLGFFVYGVGGAIDQAFFPERLPTPTFGTGGLLWASLTLSLLTVPVVIVSTEEALLAIPKGIREGSISLGATKFQTLWRILLPSATPGIITGFVLAMARAAGEVAPLMITGVVKLAPALPVDGQSPFLHLDRKFMHLGFHIFDVGFQSPNAEAARPMVYVTTLLLLLLVVALSLTAIILRNNMRRKYSARAF